MQSQFLFLLFFLFIGFTISDDEIIKNKTIYFQFENKDSYYFAHLNYEEDYEPGISHKVLDIHYLKIDHRIKVLYNISIQNDSNVTYVNEMEIMDINEEIKLGRYNKLKKGEILFLKIILKDEYKNLYDKNQIFSIEMANSSLITEEPLNISYKFELNFRPKEVRIFKIPNFDINKINEIDNYRNNKFCNIKMKLLFARFGNSAIFQDDGKIYYEMFSHQLLYGILYDSRYYESKDCLPLIDFVVYNIKDEYRAIGIEYQIKEENEIFYIMNLNSLNTGKESFYKYSYAIINSNQPGFFNIKLTDKAFCSYFDDDEEKIKNIDDLLDLNHYKYISQGILYFPKKYFIFFIDIQSYYSLLYLTKLNIEEKGNEVNDLSFYYFKISKENTLNFTSKFPKNPYVIKLFSNEKGIVNINNHSYNFEREKIEIIQLKENETFSITAIDGDFYFGIKSKISNELIDFAKSGENYTLPKTINYRFVVYELNYIDYITFYFYFKSNYKEDLFYSYDFAYADINEIQVKENPSETTDFFLHLSPYRKRNLFNNKFYFAIFFGNITSNISDIIIQSYNYKDLPTEKNKYIKIEGRYFNFGKKNYSEKYLGIPCEKLYLQRISNLYKYFELKDKRPFILSLPTLESDSSDTVVGTEGSYAYINYHNLSEEKNVYFYNEDCLDSFINLKNETHFTFSFSNFFSNESEIDYMLVITLAENLELFEPICSFFENFYLNNNFKDNKTIEFYNFSLKDIIISNDDKNYCGKNKIDLPFPSKFDMLTINKKFIFKAMGITSKFKDIKIYNPVIMTITICNSNSNCETCSRKNPKVCLTCFKHSEYKYLLNNLLSSKNCVKKCPFYTILDKKNYQCKDNYILFISVIIIVILIIAIIIYIIRRKKRLNKQKEDNLIKEINTELLPQ